MFQQLIQWFDAYADAPGPDEDRSRHIEWTRVLPFVLLHASCLFVFTVGFSWFALGLFFVSYLVRLFGITGVYHRYFAHRAYRVGRAIKAGRVWTNCYHLYPAHAAFGGYKKSGVGRETHKMMLDHYQQVKNVLVSYSPKRLGFF